MSDIFREVDDDLRSEQLKRLWWRFAPYIVGLAILIVVAVSGYQLWEHLRLSQAEATGDRFVAALQLSASGRYDEAITALEAIVDDGSGGYPTLAGFRIAAEKASAGDHTGAIAEYDAIAASRAAPQEVANLARLRAAFLVVDEVDFADLENRIGDLAAIGNPWRHTAREILGLGAWRAGDYFTAKSYFDDINNDQETPQDLRQRSRLMLALIAAKQPAAAGGAKPQG